MKRRSLLRGVAALPVAAVAAAVGIKATVCPVELAANARVDAEFALLTRARSAGIVSMDYVASVFGIPIEEWVAERRAFSETWITESLAHEPEV